MAHSNKLCTLCLGESNLRKTGKMKPFNWLADDSSFPIVTGLLVRDFTNEHILVKILKDYIKGGIVVVGVVTAKGVIIIKPY